jgi:hypothetical protein
MAKSKRANGAGSVYIKHGAYYGRWLTEGGGHTNRKLGQVRGRDRATALRERRRRSASAT